MIRYSWPIELKCSKNSFFISARCPGTHLPLIRIRVQFQTNKATYLYCLWSTSGLRLSRTFRHLICGHYQETSCYEPGCCFALLDQFHFIQPNSSQSGTRWNRDIFYQVFPFRSTPLFCISTAIRGWPSCTLPPPNPRPQSSAFYLLFLSNWPPPPTIFNILSPIPQIPARHIPPKLRNS